MIFFCIIFFGAVLSSSKSNVVNPGPKYRPTVGAVWPQPQSEYKSNMFYTLNPTSFRFQIKLFKCDLLTDALERYSLELSQMSPLAKRLKKSAQSRSRSRFPYSAMDNVSNVTNFDVHENYKGLIEKLEIYLSRPCATYPSLDMDETYNLTVRSVSQLRSSSIWGVIRGLETFYQLFYIIEEYSEVIINGTLIEDAPRYPHRGLMLDTARHYISPRNILRTLDAMAYNKLNVFHWHIVDDQSFPYQSQLFPELSDKGAYSISAVYTVSDVAHVVNYARDRGIRVIPEFDVPGHTRSWGEAYPGVLTKCFTDGRLDGLGPMDPTKNMTYKLLRDLFREAVALFRDQCFHIGGDEVDFHCWASNPRIRKFLSEFNIKDYSEFQVFFTRHAINLLDRKITPIVWEDVYWLGDLPKNVIVQSWKSGYSIGEAILSEDKYTFKKITLPYIDIPIYCEVTGQGNTPVRTYRLSFENWPSKLFTELVIQILMDGHRVIFSSLWYLDQLATLGSWQDMYLVDPREMINNEEYEERVIGGEACMWGEKVDDNNIISRVWPRACAVAERLWSTDHDLIYAHHRIEEQTCRLVRRGIKAQPPSGPGYCAY